MGDGNDSNLAQPATNLSPRVSPLRQKEVIDPSAWTNLPIRIRQALLLSLPRSSDVCSAYQNEYFSANCINRGLTDVDVIVPKLLGCPTLANGLLKTG